MFSFIVLQITFAEILLQGGADRNKWTYDYEPLLCWASRKNELKIAELLIEYGANVDGKDSGGSTPLHHSAHYRLVDMAKMLFAAGADPNSRSVGGYTPLMDAVSSIGPELVDLFLAHCDITLTTSDGRNIVHSIVGCYPREFSIRILQDAIRAGVDISAKTFYEGETPLAIAISHHHLVFCKFLTKEGCDGCVYLGGPVGRSQCSWHYI